MHVGFPFEHLSDYDQIPVFVRGTVAGFDHEDDIYGRGAGKDIIRLTDLEIFTVKTWVPLVVDTSDYNTGNLASLSCTYTKQMQKLGVKKGSQIQFRATGKKEQCQGYSYHGNPYWYTHPTIIRPCQVALTQYDYSHSQSILIEHDRFVEEYWEEKHREYEEWERERKNRVKTPQEIEEEQRGQKIVELRKLHKQGKIQLIETQLKKGGFKGVSNEEIDRLLASARMELA